MASYEKPDFWSLKAQKEGYPARSVYKLKEIDEKFGLFRRDPKKSPAGQNGKMRVLDLGAAPGSWSLYILRRYGGKSAVSQSPSDCFLAASDLLPLSRRFDEGLFDRKDFFFIQGDFTTSAVQEEICRRGPYTALVSDAAPGTTGSRTVDTLRSAGLAEEVLGYADQCLAPGGNMAVKVFQGAGTAELLKTLREKFESAKSFKPAACRSDSFETYYIGLGKRE
jgi:23S rRNA (uridine2552-2'-O)-methyltransferase